MKKIYLLLFTLLLIGCEKDAPENNSTDETQIDLITGINIRSFVNSPATRLGNPNINNNNNFIAFPNPPIGTLFITSNNVISDVWIVPSTAEKSFQQVDFNEILKSDLYTENEINSLSDSKFLNQNSNNLTLNLENLDVGYYKVFVKINGTFYWENIYSSDGSQEIEELIDFWK
ncbi:hypothetical protein SAMN05192540_2682 [Maribacter dokdonensis]|uniref:Lipoprotein n=1 Tax=Maribacter dokdonensis TaxID=320912 RepID=A0A1H4QV04_9FLAO|nr:hypothetical protein [Maribacter dokdonensis]SEC23402.1 hypothetical protein SAMN05192540_2682 [Maribacter dokdonensis]